MIVKNKIQQQRALKRHTVRQHVVRRRRIHCQIVQVQPKSVLVAHMFKRVTHVIRAIPEHPQHIPHLDVQIHTHIITVKAVSILVMLRRFVVLMLIVQMALVQQIS